MLLSLSQVKNSYIRCYAQNNILKTSIKRIFISFHELGKQVCYMKNSIFLQKATKTTPTFHVIFKMNIITFFNHRQIHWYIQIKLKRSKLSKNTNVKKIWIK